MKLQRHEPHIYSSLLGETHILFEASDTGEWVKKEEALAEIARLRAALGRIKAHTNITWIKDVCKKALEDEKC